MAQFPSKDYIVPFTPLILTSLLEDLEWVVLRLYLFKPWVIGRTT